VIASPEPWLRLGDRALAFSDPGTLRLALAAPLFLALALLLPRLARRDGRDEPGGWRPGPWFPLSSALRTLAYLAAVGAASGAAILEIQREDRLSVAALLDRSSSMSAADRAWSDARLAELVAALRPDDRLSVVEFGRDARLVSGPGAPELPDAREPAVDAGATNLMAALDSGASLAESSGVLLLLSDANQTTGDVRAAAESARRRGLRVFAALPPREQATLAIEGLAAPESVREGRDVRLAVAVANRGREGREATLVARQGDRVLGRVPLRLAPGRTVVDADVAAGAPGHYTISVSLESSDGGVSTSSRRFAGLSVLQPPRVLLVSHDAAFEPLLREAGFQVTRVENLDGIDAEQLARRHAVVLGDVVRDDLPPGAQRALDEYVREAGGGLLVAAGRGLVADPALRGSTFERLLPVRVREQQQPKKQREPIALFLVLDRSSSMTYGIVSTREKPSRMEYARQAALALVSQLSDEDRLGVVAFDTQTSVLAPLRPLSESRAEVADAIARLQPSGGTDFKEALEIAARQLVGSGQRTRHVILITDGASIRPAGEHAGLIEALASSGITVTSIRVGDEQESVELVREIADRTGGSFHLVTDGEALPSLLVDDTKRRAGRDDSDRRAEEARAAREASFRPQPRPAEALGGLDREEMPVLHGMAIVPLKSDAEAWLVADRGGERAPVLAGWQNGLGRVAVFTADPSSEWQSWQHARRFWAQLVRWVARPQAGDEVRLALRREGARPVLSIDTFEPGEAGDLTVRVTGRDGTVRDLVPAALGPRHHEVGLPPLEAIEPRVVVTLRRDGRTLFSHDEWLPPAAGEEEVKVEDPEAEPDRALAAQVAEITGGAVDAPLEAVLARAPAERHTARPLARALAALALALAAADVAIRLLPTGTRA
jgi:Mg-chelatase subunit ChlD